MTESEFLLSQKDVLDRLVAGLSQRIGLNLTYRTEHTFTTELRDAVAEMVQDFRDRRSDIAGTPRTAGSQPAAGTPSNPIRNEGAYLTAIRSSLTTIQSSLATRLGGDNTNRTEDQYLAALITSLNAANGSLNTRLVELATAGYAGSISYTAAGVTNPPPLPARIRTFGVFSPIATNNEADGTVRLTRYANWLGRTVTRVTDNGSETGDFAQLKSTSIAAAAFWRAKPVDLLLRVPLLPKNNERQFTALKRGDFDTHFQEVANYLKPMIDRVVNGKVYTLTIGLGWENNGNWYPWFGGGDPAGYKAGYERIAALFLATDPRFRLDWNCTLGQMNIAASAIMPNPDSFHTLSTDIYDEFQAYQASLYGFGKEVERFRDRYKGGNFGLDWWAGEARRLGKDFMIPEWGVCDWRKYNSDGSLMVSGGDDNPIFIEKMAEWMDANGDVLVWQSYFERFYTGVNHALSRGPLVNGVITPTKMPKSAEAFLRLFGA